MPMCLVWFVCQQTIEKCGCLSSDLSFSTEQLKRANYTMCRNQTWLEYDETNPTSSSNELNAIRQLVCLYETDLSFKECIRECKPPCKELEYSTTNSHSSPWPHTSHHLAFYKEYIAKDDYKDNFADYAEINDNLAKNIISKVRY